MRNRLLPIVFVVLLAALVAVGFYYRGNMETGDASSALGTAPSGVPSPEPSPLTSPTAPAPLPSSNPNPDLSVDDSGLSRTTGLLSTSQGLIKFKFYPVDAPNTVKRLIELIQQGFYNGLTWHRVAPGFVIQGGDPQGSGTGGSGQKLNAEFNERRHIEGTMAMARTSDPNSADSQFYISLGTAPHLDRSYTVFGQVIEGMDVARKIKVGDKILGIVLQ